jgi:hypothetical protein
MKKRSLFIFIILSTLLILNIVTTFVRAADQSPLPVMPNIPIIGDINPDTGVPKTFEKFKEASENLSKEEITKRYLQKEWTVILAKNPVWGPIFFYTGSAFSKLNFLWRIAFGVDFSWSWAFFFSFIIWVMFIIIFYSPSKNLTNFNPILTLIFSVVLATIMGTTGIIRSATNALSFAISNLWLVGLSILVAGFGMMLYIRVIKQIGSNLKEKEKKEKLGRAEKMILAHGEVLDKSLKDLSKKR